MISLKPEYESRKSLKDLNKLIKEVLEFKTIYFSDHYKKTHLIEFFISNLINKTNIEKELNNIKASIDSINFNPIFSCLKGKQEHELTRRLLNKLELELNQIKRKDIDIYNFIFPINISSFDCITKFIESQKINFDYILSLFGLKLLEKNDYEFFWTDKIVNDPNKDKHHIQELISLLSDSKFGGLIFEVNIEARSPYYAHKEAVHKIEVFLGFLSFIVHFLGTHQSYYSRFDKDRKLKISNLSSDNFFVTKNKNKLIHPFHYVIYQGKYEQIPFWEDKVKRTIKELENIENFDIKNCDYGILQELIDIFRDRNLNKSIMKTLEDALILYYYGMVELNLDYSFLKFWMLSELIIKKNEKISYETLKSRMINILKSVVKLPTEGFLKEEIYFLTKKRNNLVHSGEINIIRQVDRNMSKLIAESVLRLYIEWIPLIKESHEFDFVIDNLRRNKNVLDQRSFVLNTLITPTDGLIGLILYIAKNNQYDTLSQFINVFKNITGETNEDYIKSEIGKLIADGWLVQGRNTILFTDKIINKDNDLVFYFNRFN